MASYKYPFYVTQINSDAFDQLYKPGDTPPHSGIYRCQQCNVEIVAEQSRSFPPTHACQGTTRWRLAVYAVHKVS